MQHTCVVTSGRCDTVADCEAGLECDALHTCTDPCAVIECPAWKSCVAGSCELLSDRCDTVADCEAGLECDALHTCTDPCAVIECPAWRVCTQGECTLAPGHCESGSDCDQPQVCNERHHCVDTCDTSVCEEWQVCGYWGKCIASPNAAAMDIVTGQVAGTAIASWPASGPDTSATELYVDGGLVSVVTGDSQSFGGLAPGSTHQVMALARDRAGKHLAPSMRYFTAPFDGPLAAREPRVRPVYLGDQRSCRVQLDWADEYSPGGVQRYDVYRDGALLASTDVSLLEDAGPSPGPHVYDIVTVDDLDTPSPPATLAIDTTGCIEGLAPDAYAVRELQAYILPERFDTQVNWTSPTSTEGMTGTLVYVDGRLQWQRTYAASVPEQDGYGGIDRFHPGTHGIYHVAPAYGEGASRVGPLVRVDVEVPPAPDAPLLPSMKVAVILVRLAGMVGEPFSPEYAGGVVYADAYSVARYYERVSFGRQHVTGAVFGWLDMPLGPTDYCYETTLVDGQELGSFASCYKGNLDGDAGVLAEATTDYRQADFDRTVYVISGVTGCASAGGVSVDASSSCFYVDTLVHELGHTLGLAHSGWWDCRDATNSAAGPSLDDQSLGGACDAFIYGDAADPMAVTARHLNAEHKLLAGYRPESTTDELLGSGDVVLTAVESPEPSGVMELRIPLAPDRAYLVEYREDIDFDAGIDFPDYFSATDERAMQSGLHVWLWTNSGDADTLFVGDNPWGADVASEGIDFYDPFRRIRIQLLERLENHQARARVLVNSD